MALMLLAGWRGASGEGSGGNPAACAVEGQAGLSVRAAMDNEASVNCGR